MIAKGSLQAVSSAKGRGTSTTNREGQSAGASLEKKKVAIKWISGKEKERYGAGNKSAGEEKEGPLLMTAKFRPIPVLYRSPLNLAGGLRVTRRTQLVNREGSEIYVKGEKKRASILLAPKFRAVPGEKVSSYCGEGGHWGGPILKVQTARWEGPNDREVSREKRKTILRMNERRIPGTMNNRKIARLARNKGENIDKKDYAAEGEKMRPEKNDR